jgi:hypothetical protein
MDLVPIKVKIGLNSKGHAGYPNFNLVSSSVRKGMDWAEYVDAHGTGWHYDKTSGHKDHTLDSPYGQQWGMILVPKDFADEVVALFPSDCTKLTELEAEDFYDNKAHKHEPEFKVDEESLKIYDVKEKFKISLTPEEETKKSKALDPDDDEPGITRNKNKTWQLHKASKNITIIQ